MARLPQPGGDQGNWGDILNDYLDQSHNADGTIKNGTVGASQLQNSAVVGSKIADASISVAKIAATGTASSATYLRGDGSWATIPDAVSDTVIYLAGAGVDPSGVTISTSAVRTIINNAPVGSIVVVPSDAVIALDGQIDISKRLNIRGSGELRFVSGIAEAHGLNITAQGSTVTDIKISNPNELGSDLGAISSGIYIQAHDVSVSGVTIDRFQNGVVVALNGEWEGTSIDSCRITVIGAGHIGGTGPVVGEDRGDGITIWGSRSRATNNIVMCKAGCDARVGVHAEGLSEYEIVDNPDFVPGNYVDSMVLLSGNVVSGKFRRGVVAENILGYIISNNIVSDATWWGVAGVYGHGLIANNSIRWTRKASDTQGSSWNPVRSGIMAFETILKTVISSNEVRILAGSEAYSGITVEGDSENVVINSNVVSIEGSGTLVNGIRAINASRVSVFGNDVSFKPPLGSEGIGIHSWKCVESNIASNRIDGPGASAADTFGLKFEEDSSATVTGNYITQTYLGIGAIAMTGGIFRDNTIIDATNGFDGWDTSPSTIIYGRSRVVNVSGDEIVNFTPAP